MKKDEQHNHVVEKLRRPFGIAILPVSDIVAGKKENTDKEIFVALQLLANNDDVEGVIRKIIQKVVAPQIQASGQGKLLSGDDSLQSFFVISPF